MKKKETKRTKEKVTRYGKNQITIIQLSCPSVIEIFICHKLVNGIYIITVERSQTVKRISRRL